MRAGIEERENIKVTDSTLGQIGARRRSCPTGSSRSGIRPPAS